MNKVNTNVITVSIAAVIVTLIAVGALLISQNTSYNTKRQSDETKQSNITSCNSRAEVAYRQYWDGFAERINGDKNKRELPQDIAEEANRFLASEKERCFKIYSL